MRKEKKPNKKSNPEIDPIDDFFDEIIPRRHFRSPFNLFEDFDEQFRRMHRQMNTLFNRYQRGEIPKPEEGGPYIYGYTFRVGSDGKPHFQEFGNVPKLRQAQQQNLIQSREPLVDIQDHNGTIMLDIEIPGVNKNEIDLEANPDTISIQVNNPDRNYQKTIELPAEIDPDSAKATFNNGILSLELKKMQPKHKGKKLNIK